MSPGLENPSPPIGNWTSDIIALTISESMALSSPLIIIQSQRILNLVFSFAWECLSFPVKYISSQNTGILPPFERTANIFIAPPAIAIIAKKKAILIIFLAFFDSTFFVNISFIFERVKHDLLVIVSSSFLTILTVWSKMHCCIDLL